MRTLYEIGADLSALEALLYETGGELGDDAAEEAFDKWFSSLGSERDAKLDAYAGLIQEIEARAQSRRFEAKRLAGRAQIDENAAYRLKDRLTRFFIAHQLKTIETPRFRLTLATNGGKQAMTVLVPA